MSGIVNPDTWEIDSNATEIIASALGSKKLKAISHPDGGFELVSVPVLDSQRFAITNPQALHIARSIRDIGQFYQELLGYRFIDTEFVIDQSGKLYFVQARPETVFSGSLTPHITGIPQKIASEAPILYQGGATGYPGAYTGRLVYAKTAQEAFEKIRPGDILLAARTRPSWSIVFPKLGGIIVDVGGVLSHTAIVGREQRMPTILSAVGATETLSHLDGTLVTIDSLNNVVYSGALNVETGEIDSFIREDIGGNANTVADQELQIHHTDAEGSWMRVLPIPLSTFQLSIFEQSYDEIEEIIGLDAPIDYKIVDGLIFIKVADQTGPQSYAKITDCLLNWSLDDLAPSP